MSNRRGILFTALALLIPLLFAETAVRLLWPWLFRLEIAPPWPRLAGADDTHRREFRVLALGDSQTAGASVPPDYTWPVLMGQALGVQVRNAARGGTGPLDFLPLLEQAASFHPNLVIYGFYSGNDLYDCFQGAYYDLRFRDFQESETEFRHPIDAAEARQKLSDFIDEPYQHAIVRYYQGKRPARHSLRLRELANIVLAEIAAHHGFLPSASDGQWEDVKFVTMGLPDYLIIEQPAVRTVLTPDYRLRAVNLGDPRVRDGLRICLKALEQMHDYWEKKGVSFLVLGIPTKELVFQPWAQREKLQSESYPALVQNETLLWQLVSQFFERERIGYLNALPELRANTRREWQPYQVSPDGHPNVTGNQAIAQAVIKRLLAKELAGH